MRPLVSVIVAVFRAEATIAATIASVFAGGWPDVEIVVSPDDGQDYTPHVPRDPRVVLLPAHAGPSGAGPARNRALAAAHGTYVAMLDSDDAWSPGYLAALIPQAERTGMAFAEIHYVAPDGRLVRSLPGPMASDAVNFETFRTLDGSLHGVVRRDLVRPFAECFAEDVLWEMQALSAAGGSAPLVRGATYLARLRDGSLTAGGTREAEIDTSYRWLIDRIGAGDLSIAPCFRQTAIATFERRRVVNRLYADATSTRPGLNYQEFVRDLNLKMKVLS